MEESGSAGGVIIRTESREVIIVSQKHKSWSLPKGHIESGETPLEAAYREICEETGLEKKDLSLIKELGTYSRHMIAKNPEEEDRSVLKHITMFLFTSRSYDLLPKDSNNPYAVWVDISEAENYLTHPKDRDFYRRVMPDIMGVII